VSEILYDDCGVMVLTTNGCETQPIIKIDVWDSPHGFYFDSVEDIDRFIAALTDAKQKLQKLQNLQRKF